MSHHHHDAAAAPAAAAKAKVPELSAHDLKYTPEPVAWKDLNHYERKAVANYAIGKGRTYLPTEPDRPRAREIDPVPQCCTRSHGSLPSPAGTPLSTLRCLRPPLASSSRLQVRSLSILVLLGLLPECTSQSLLLAPLLPATWRCTA